MVGWVILYGGRQGLVVAAGASSGILSSIPEKWSTSSPCTPSVMGNSLSTWTIHTILEPFCMNGDFFLIQTRSLSLHISHPWSVLRPQSTGSSSTHHTLYLETMVMSLLQLFPGSEKYSRF